MTLLKVAERIGWKGIVRPHPSLSPGERVLIVDVLKLLKTFPPIQSWVHAKALRACPLFSAGKGRDEDGQSTSF
jgi:hypothetical protein